MEKINESLTAYKNLLDIAVKAGIFSDADTVVKMTEAFTVIATACSEYMQLITDKNANDAAGK